ncbi:MAG: nucleoside-diphosphate sugar epimerase/dehydratase [Pseudomonadota bacterium]
MYDKLIETSRFKKKFILLMVDTAVIAVCVLLAIMLRIGEIWPAAIIQKSMPLLVMMPIAGLFVGAVMKTQNTSLSSFGLAGAATVFNYALTLTVIATAVNILVPLGAPRSVPLIAGFLIFTMSFGWKAVAYGLLTWLKNKETQRRPVAVYGAGSAGLQLISSLASSDSFRVAAVVDNNPNLIGIMVGGLKVESPARLEALAKNGSIEEIFLAMPSVSERRKREILAQLSTLPCEVRSLPAYIDLIRNGGGANSLKPVDSNDLLGRDSVDLDIPEISEAYQGKTVLISGAGGSIGSELCRQVLSCAPKRIVLLERSEFALYSIDRELRPLAEAKGVEIETVLGSVTDRRRIERTLLLHEVNIVLHAAAYKHVPLVEENELEGVNNNIFGTQILAEAAGEAGVERFILISTDKAVRPTNVMGSTKRLAEIVIQDLQTRCAGTHFAIVRFGNVLGSSGSVIPLFRSQIAQGGPVTLTHSDVTRYFMTLPEAARLVLLAGSYADGGDVFVLDMGQPMKIRDLALRMIELSGRTVRDAANPDGDIEIKVTGLRPGEKLYEELLIDDDSLVATPHKKILRAQEFCPSQIEVAGILQEFRTALEIDSPSAARGILERWVEGYHPSEPQERRVAGE